MNLIHQKIYRGQLQIKRNLSLVNILFGIMILLSPEFSFRGLLYQSGCYEAVLLYASIFIIWGLIFLNPYFDKYTTNNYLWVLCPIEVHLIANIIDFTILHPEWASNPDWRVYPLVVIYASYLYLVYLLELHRNCEVKKDND